MHPFTLLALLLTLAALFSYVNLRYVGLPMMVGLMLLSSLLALGLIAADALGWPVLGFVHRLLDQVDLSQTLLGGALSFLLFAAALNIEFRELHDQRWRVMFLAFGGTLLSLFLVAGLAWLMFRWIRMPLPLLYCLIFGALISPTDPVAAMGLLREAKAPPSLEAKIMGESLFNDGVGLAGFTVFVESLVATGPKMDVDWAYAGKVLLQEAGGGILLGLVLGALTIRLFRGVDHYPVEVLLTLALVSGGYALALQLHTSGPLTVATAGLMIGHTGRKEAMSEQTRRNLERFWELIDEILNALLFVLVGLQVTVIKFLPHTAVVAGLTILVVLAARLLSVGVPGVALRVFRRPVERGGVLLLTWGGLRGGISVALALSLPGGAERDLLLTMTYAVVAFSILVQGTTLPWVLRRSLRQMDRSP